MSGGYMMKKVANEFSFAQISALLTVGKPVRINEVIITAVRTRSMRGRWRKPRLPSAAKNK
jgi:hypothetical protein